VLQRKTTGTAAVVLGIVLFIAGLVDHHFAAPRAALCQSGIGQLVQGFDGTVAHDCGLVTTLEAAVGWLLVVGILAAVFGAAVLYNSRATPQPAAPPIVTAPPGPQTSQPVEPASSAERPWWTQT
jgi:hypothetical protein